MFASPLRMTTRAIHAVSRTSAIRSMSTIKPMYTAHATATGGRNGHVTSSDGVLDLHLTMPKGLGGPGEPNKTNPEQLFAAGYSACFQGAMNLVAGKMKIHLPEDTKVTANVSIGTDETKALGLAVELQVSAPGLDKDKVQKVIEAAHEHTMLEESEDLDLDLSGLSLTPKGPHRSRSTSNVSTGSFSMEELRTILGEEVNEENEHDDDEKPHPQAEKETDKVTAASSANEQLQELQQFLAQKERKVKQLRDELQAHEEELSLLRRRYQEVLVDTACKTAINKGTLNTPKRKPNLNLSKLPDTHEPLVRTPSMQYAAFSPPFTPSMTRLGYFVPPSPASPRARPPPDEIDFYDASKGVIEELGKWGATLWKTTEGIGKSVGENELFQKTTHKAIDLSREALFLAQNTVASVTENDVFDRSSTRAISALEKRFGTRPSDPLPSRDMYVGMANEGAEAQVDGPMPKESSFSL